MIRRLAPTLALGLAVAVPTLAIAGGPGQTVQVDNAIKIRDAAPAFHGRVVGDSSDCVFNRPVRLFEQKRSGSRKLLGSTSAAASGKWEVIVDPLASGAYFAVARKVEIGTAGTIYVCYRSKSKLVAVD